MGPEANGTNFLLDNGDHNDSFVNVALPFPNPDAVQEFSVQTSTFDAKYGRGISCRPTSACLSAFSGSGAISHGRMLRTTCIFFQAGQEAIVNNMTVNHSWVISPNLVNDATFTANRTDSNSFPPEEFKNYTFGGFGANVLSPQKQPYMVTNITGWSGINLGQGYTQVQKNYQFSNTLNFATGWHNLKIGGEYRRFSQDKTAPFQAGGAATFSGQMFSNRGLNNAGNAFAEIHDGADVGVVAALGVVVLND